MRAARWAHPRSLVLFAGTLALLVGCDSIALDKGEHDSLRLSISALGDECGIVSAEATISSPYIATIGPVALQVEEDSITGAIPDVSLGQHTLEVTANNNAGLAVYEGSAQVRIRPDTTTTVTVALTRNQTNCPLDAVPADGPKGTIGGTASHTTVLSFGFEHAQLSDDGILALLSGNNLRRYNVASQTVITDVPLPVTATRLAASASGDQIFVGYPDGTIERLEAPANFQPQLFAQLAGGLDSILAIDDCLLAIEATDTRSTLLFDRSTGTLLDSAEYSATDRALVWAPVMQRIFLRSRYVSPRRLYFRDIDTNAGILGPEVQSPTLPIHYFTAPIRLYPDESLVVTGEGEMFQTENLVYHSDIGYRFEDMAFIGGNYYLAQNIGETTHVLVIDSIPLQDVVIGGGYFPGTVRNLYAHGDELVLLTETGPEETTVYRIPAANLLPSD